MPKGLNFPLYIPESCAAAVRLIAKNRIDDAIEAVERKAAFGDTGAAALLGYLQLRQALPNPKGDLIRTRLRAAAEKGDPYAEFVLALALRALGHEAAAAQWMSRSANHVFPPAQAHLGRYMIHGIGLSAPSRASAWEMYRLALRSGHIPTTAFVADWLKSSRNVFARILGLILFPIAALAIAIQFTAKPFSVRSFIHVSDDDRPLFSGPARPTI